MMIEIDDIVDIEDKEKVFSTRNTALAALLRAEGFELLDVDMVEDHVKPAVFYFRNHPEIKKLEHLWQVGKMEGNINDFFESYRLCLRMIHVGKL